MKTALNTPWKRSRSIYAARAADIADAVWLLEQVPESQHRELASRFPLARLVSDARALRRPVSLPWVVRVMECSRAQGYRLLYGLQEAGFKVEAIVGGHRGDNRRPAVLHVAGGRGR